MGILAKVRKIYRDAGAVADAVTLEVAEDLERAHNTVRELEDVVEREGMFTEYTSDRGSTNKVQSEAFKALATWQRIKTDKSRLLEGILRRDMKAEADLEDY